MDGREEVWTRIGSATALRTAGCSVVSAGGHTLAVVATGETLHAIDNRCPHMGFPLHRGSIKDGILTCHWHHARFDLCSGGTLDPFADDVRSYPVRVEGDDVLVDVAGRGSDIAYWRRRLRDGMEQGLTLVVAKAVLALRAAALPDTMIVALAGEYGLQYRDAGWGSGMTILTALAKELVNELMEFDGECDFVQDFAAHYPTRVTMAVLGVPREDHAQMLDLGADDLVLKPFAFAELSARIRALTT